MKKLLVSVQDFRSIVEDAFAPDFSATSQFPIATANYSTLSDALSKCSEWLGYDDEREEIEEVLQYDIRYSFMLAIQAVVTRVLSGQGISNDHLNHGQLREGGVVQKGDTYYVSCDSSLVYRFCMKDIGVPVSFEIPVADWSDDEALTAAILKLQEDALESYSRRQDRFDVSLQAERDFRILSGNLVQKFREEANVAYLDYLRAEAISSMEFPSSIERLLGSANEWLHGDAAPSYRLAVGSGIGVAIQKLVAHLLTTHYSVHHESIKNGMAFGNVDYQATDSVSSGQSIYSRVFASVDYTSSGVDDRIDARVDIPIEHWSEDWAIQNAIESVIKTVDRSVSRSRRALVQS